MADGGANPTMPATAPASLRAAMRKLAIARLIADDLAVRGVGPGEEISDLIHAAEQLVSRAHG